GVWSRAVRQAPRLAPSAGDPYRMGEPQHFDIPSREADTQRPVQAVVRPLSEGAAASGVAGTSARPARRRGGRTPAAQMPDQGAARENPLAHLATIVLGGHNALRLCAAPRSFLERWGHL